ncbi:hypothetical protein E3N88_35039 [Mikania micrantha]|uniref:Uncharacterized protein n=1 Tax=Mikania micrantha TaxID=192012 RepID=A0A5N6LZU8_9ASTR|nr:hypothetical protein E3N88_35039 [Mikania micrantha]
MEEIKTLRLKENILLVELKAIQEKIALYDESLRTTANSEQESERKKSESIPSQTTKGKEKSSPLIPIALEKSKNKVKEELQSSSSPESKRLCQEDFENEHLYTEDKASISLIIFCPGSSPEMVSLAFSAGLIKFIYPSPNLLEISLFSKGIKKAIKNFRKKIASAKDASIFIKCTSTLPDWYKGRSFPCYHHLEIGIAKARTVNPSKVMTKENSDPKNWVEIKTRIFIKILNNLQKIENDNFIKVNYYSNNCIITSHCGSPLSSFEKEHIAKIEDKIISNIGEVGRTTHQSLCSSLSTIIEDHNCKECGSHSDKASTDKESFFSEEDTRELDPTHGFID